MDKGLKRKLEKFAAQIRVETLKEIDHLGFGHLGGAMSVVEVLAVLYGEIMRIDPKDPKWPDRDYCVVSKGHSGPALYATLALKGYFPMDQLLTLNQNGTNLPSHCDRNKTIGIDMTTGSLGQGVSSSIGIALGNRLDKRDNYTYLVVGDGEIDEGQCWEGFMFAAHYKLDNLICFIDYNKKQLDGYVKDIMDSSDIADKMRAFRWHTQVVDGRSVEAIYEAIIKAKEAKGTPSAIVLDTIKGQGVPYLENMESNHHVALDENGHKEIAKTIAELEKKITEF